METKQMKSSKGIYITLAIMLTIQAVPVVGLFINMIYIYAIAGTIIAIIALSLSKYDNRKKVGPILGLIGFLMAIFSGTFFYIFIEESYTSDTTEVFYFLWMMIDWAIVITGAIFTYIAAFRRQPLTVDGRPQQAFQREVGTPVEIGFQKTNTPVGQPVQTVQTVSTQVEEQSNSPIGDEMSMKFKGSTLVNKVENTEDNPLPEIIITEEKQAQDVISVTEKLTTFAVSDDILPLVDEQIKEEVIEIPEIDINDSQDFLNSNNENREKVKTEETKKSEGMSSKKEEDKKFFPNNDK